MTARFGGVAFWFLVASCVCGSAFGAAPREQWAASSVAWLSSGDDGKFVDPRILCSDQALVGTAWEERRATSSCAGFSKCVPSGWKVYPCEREARLRGLAACLEPGGAPVLAYGTDGGVKCARLEGDRWAYEAVSSRPGQLLDLVLLPGGALAALYTEDAPEGDRPRVARSTPEGWSSAALPLPAAVRRRGRAQVGPGRIVAAPDGRPVAVFLAGSGKGRRLCRARPDAGGWTSEALPAAVGGLTPEGHFGLALDGQGRLTVAYKDEASNKLFFASLDTSEVRPIEPEPGAVLRWPQVDLAFDRDGRAHVNYFAVTPDGGLQIRLARFTDGRWSSLMVDRTMAKNSLASLSLGLRSGSVPFMSYALGPARAVLLAYPKDQAPHGPSASATSL